jgi:hypothetical protein
MSDIKMTAIFRVGIKLFHQISKIGKAVADFGMQFQGGLKAIALDPL